MSRLYLSAVLPCLTDLVAQDPTAHDILGEAQASIVLRIAGGPAATLHLENGRIVWKSGAGPASIVLLFLNSRHLNAFFSGKTWAVPVPIWGGWRIALLQRFARLAGRLEAALNGDEAMLATEVGRRLHARLSLIVAVLGLRSLAEGDEAARQALRSVPPGLAAFSIAGDPGATLWFDHGSADCAAGWGEAPRSPLVHIIFADMNVAFGAMRDEIDAVAAVGSGQIKIEGLVPLADGLNVAMERLRVYLRPP